MLTAFLCNLEVVDISVGVGQSFVDHRTLVLPPDEHRKAPCHRARSLGLRIIPLSSTHNYGYLF